MQQPNGSYCMTGNNMKYSTQTNQNHFGRMHNSMQREDSSTGLSPVPGRNKIQNITPDNACGFGKFSCGKTINLTYSGPYV